MSAHETDVHALFRQRMRVSRIGMAAIIAHRRGSFKAGIVADTKPRERLDEFNELFGRSGGHALVAAPQGNNAGHCQAGQGQ